MFSSLRRISSYTSSRTGATNNPGNVFPGASVPFGMAKIGIDLDGVYAPAGEFDRQVILSFEDLNFFLILS